MYRFPAPRRSSLRLIMILLILRSRATNIKTRSLCGPSLRKHTHTHTQHTGTLWQPDRIVGCSGRAYSQFSSHFAETVNPDRTQNARRRKSQKTGYCKQSFEKTCELEVGGGGGEKEKILSY